MTTNFFGTDDVRVWTDNEVNELTGQSIKLLEAYDYNPTEYAVRKILHTSNRNKGWIEGVLSKHPNYIADKHYIVLNSDYHRVVNKRDVCEFYDWFAKNAKDAYVCKFGKEIFGKEIIEIDFDSAKYKLCTKDHKCFSIGFEEAKKIDDIINLIFYMEDNISTFVDAEVEGKANAIFKDGFAKVNQKTSRLVNKIAREIGLDKVKQMEDVYDGNGNYLRTQDHGYNWRFAKFADAINPLKVKRWTIISVNPIDYWTMSFGNGWASCHTIDLTNKRGCAHTYQGCYSSGTESYMLDPSTFIVYLVDEEYKGKDYEYQPKMKRCNFHIGNDKLIQGRVYPDGRDGGDEDNIAKEIREIVQSVIAECCNIPNLWIKRDIGYNDIEQDDRSTNYDDYFEYSDCNISVVKGSENDVPVHIGHAPICPSCGEEHDFSGNIECEECRDNIVYCAHCGERVSREDAVEIDGEYYCNECVFYCDYHENYEVDYGYNRYYVSEYGYICEQALESGSFGLDTYDGYLYYIDEHWVYIDDDHGYCCEANAEADGWVYDVANDEWRRKEAM